MKVVSINRSRMALTLWEVVIVLVILVVLAAMILPALQKPKVRSRVSCVNNLKQIGIAFGGFQADLGGYPFPMNVAVSNGGSMGATFAYEHFMILSNEINNPKLLICPREQERKPAYFFTNGLNDNNLSYFVNLDADVKNPRSFLVGDRNLSFNGRAAGTGLVTYFPQNTIGWMNSPHDNQGNILLSDGSVYSWSSSNLNVSLKQSGVTMNRLLIP